MAFFRVQGKRIHILHNRRDGAKVRQTRLHSFSGFAEARETVSADDQWRALVDSLELAIGSPGSINRDTLRQSLRSLVDSQPAEEDPLKQAASQLLHTLTMLQSPLTPAQLRSLRTAQDTLITLRNAVDETLVLLDDKNSEEEKDMNVIHDEQSEPVDELFERGLTHFERGEWGLARECYLTGLKHDPENVDLLVHAGLVEHVYDNELLALSRYDRAAEIGKIQIDAAIAENPEDYVKFENLVALLKDKQCIDADECPDWETKQCDGCRLNPVHSVTGLYRFHEFRPFFRALTNKAGALMRLRRYEDAIETLLLCRSYDELWGIRNMIGECYLCLNENDQAKQWYLDLLWPEAFYVRGLILVLDGQREAALRTLLTGMTQNPHIAHMLAGVEKLEEIRHIGEALPIRLRASEFVHEKGHLFRKRPGFSAMLRCALGDHTIDGLLLELREAHRRHREDGPDEVPKELFRLMSGNMDETFLDEHVPRLLKKIDDPSSDHWIPEDNAVIIATVLEKKATNWLMGLAENPMRTLYLKVGSTDLAVEEGEDIEIRITKWWYYRKRMFVTGKTSRQQSN